MDSQNDQLSQGNSSSTPVSTSLEYGDFGKRLIAWIIDAIFIGIASWAVWFVGAIFIQSIASSFEEGYSNLGVVLMLGLLTIILLGVFQYFVGMESSVRQATLGKDFMGLKVVGMNGERITRKTAAIRFIVKIFISNILYLGYLVAAITDKRQALHDIVAGTLVVAKK